MFPLCDHETRELKLWLLTYALERRRLFGREVRIGEGRFFFLGRVVRRGRGNALDTSKAPQFVSIWTKKCVRTAEWTDAGPRWMTNHVRTARSDGYKWFEGPHWRCPN